MKKINDSTPLDRPILLGQFVAGDVGGSDDLYGVFKRYIERQKDV